MPDDTNYDNMHPKIQGFHEYFRSKRNKNSDSIHSFSLIYLPFLFNKKLHNVKRHKDKDNCHCIDVDLIVMADNDYLYGDDNDDDGFQVV